MAIDFNKIKEKVGKWGSEYAQNLNQNLGLDKSLTNNSTIINTATQNIQADSSTNNLTQLSGVLGGMVGDVVTAGGGDANVARGVSTAISQAPAMFDAIKDFDASSFKAGLGSSMNIAGIAGNVLGAFAEDRASLSGEYGQLSKNAERVADTVLSSIPGFGQAYAAINGVSDFLAGKYDNLSTAGSTKSDAIMDAIPLLGLLNAAAGEEMNEIKYDKKTWDTVGSSYAGSQKSVNDAADNTGGRYGWLSTITGEYQKDLAQNIEGARQQTMASKISDEATEASERAASTIQEANIKQQNKLAGNNFTFRVQKGIKLPSKNDINKIKNLLNKDDDDDFVLNFKPDYTLVFQDGGKTEKKEEKPKTRSLEELIQYAKEQNPRFVQRMTEPLKQLDLGNGDYATHMMAWEYTDDGQAMAFPTVMENVEGNLQDYKDKALTEAYNRGDYLIMSPKEAQIFTEGYKQGWPMFFQQTPSQKFAKGGTMNIIPEGELHARLHHMEQEGITKKGIPVISEEEGGEIIQHAEIERNEIIFRLEVTKKLEELMEDGSEEAALEAGKLLVEEILNNTEDRTGLIDEVE